MPADTLHSQWTVRPSVACHKHPSINLFPLGTMVHTDVYGDHKNMNYNMKILHQATTEFTVTEF